MAARATKKAIFTQVDQIGAGTSDWIIPKRGFFNLNSFAYHILTLKNLTAGTAKIQVTSDDPDLVANDPGNVTAFDWPIGDVTNADAQDLAEGITAFRVISTGGNWRALDRAEF